MTAQLLTMPTDPAARKQRQLRAAWDEVDGLKARLRAAEAKARKLEKDVAQSLGYPPYVRREALERAMNERGR